jgi:polyhydroxybutyrate depolymerase
MKGLIVFLLWISCVAIKAQTIDSIYHGGVYRTYRLHVPAAYNPANQTPLVFNLHGNGSNSLEQQLYSGMDAIADTAIFFTVYPDGISNTWNSGFNLPFNTGTDDVGFISALIDTINSIYNIDLHRVYSCGMSMGGFMSHRLACELHNRIAAIASVAGLISFQVINNCQNDRAVPVLQIHGTADAVVPYAGTVFYTSVDEAISFWTQKDACPLLPDSHNLADISNEGSTVIRYTYSPCDDSTQVLLYKIVNGGHTWPGGIPIATLGNTNQDIVASAEIWNFFRQYSISPVSVGEIIQQEISIFPNPANVSFSVSTSEKFEKMIIRNSQEQTMHEGPLYMSNDISFLNNGIYSVELAGKKIRTVGRLVIMK